MRARVIGAALLLAAGQTAGSAAATADPTPHALPAQVQVVSAATLIGRDVRDFHGQRLGFIDYVLFDVATGLVRDVVLAPAQQMDKSADFIALSWSSLVQPLPKPWEAIRTTLLQAQVAKLPRLDAADIFGDARAVSTPPAFAMKGPGARHRATAPPRKGAPVLPPTVISDEDLEALTITNPGGQSIAAVDRVVIDAAAGRIAYLLAVPFSDSPKGPSVVAVPFEGLRWSAADATYHAEVGQGGLRPVDDRDTLVKGLGQRRIDRTTLASLFRTYEVAPYWTAAQPGTPAKSG